MKSPRVVGYIVTHAPVHACEWSFCVNHCFEPAGASQTLLFASETEASQLIEATRHHHEWRAKHGIAHDDLIIGDPRNITIQPVVAYQPPWEEEDERA